MWLGSKHFDLNSRNLRCSSFAPKQLFLGYEINNLECNSANLSFHSRHPKPGYIVRDRPVLYYVAWFWNLEKRPHSMGQVSRTMWPGFGISEKSPHSMGQTCPVLCDLVSENPKPGPVPCHVACCVCLAEGLSVCLYVCMYVCKYVFFSCWRMHVRERESVSW